jgi:hypothetical protein
MYTTTNPVNAGTRVSRRLVNLVVYVSGFALFSPMANAEFYVPNDATFSSVFTGRMIIGFDHEALQLLPPPIASSPTVNILDGAFSQTDANNSGVGAYNQSIVNMSGGLISGMGAADHSTVNVSGGTVNNLGATGNGTVNFSGGAVTASAGFLDHSTFNMSDGQIGINPQSGDVQFFSDNVATLSGGMITGDISTGFGRGAVSPATINLYGTNVGGDVFLDNSIAKLVTGSVGGSFSIINGSAFTMTGGVVGGNVSALNSTFSMTNGSVMQNVNVVGVLNITGGSILGDATVNSGSATMSDGIVWGNMVISGATTVGSMTGGSVTRNLAVNNGAVVGISGATIGTLSVRSGSEVNFAGGSVIGLPEAPRDNNVTVTGGSTLNIQSGTFSYGLIASDANTHVTIDGATFVDDVYKVISTSFATLTVNGGDFPNGIYVRSSGQALLNGGKISNVLAESSGYVAINGATISGNVYADTHATVGMTAGEVNGTISVQNASVASMTGGTASEVIVGSGGTFLLFDGHPHTVNSIASGASVAIFDGIISNQLTASNGGYASVNGGVILEVLARDSGRIDIFGGEIGRVFADGGEVNIFGGTIEPSTLVNFGIGDGALDSLFTINGSNLQLTNPLAGIFSDDSNDYNGIFWDLTGILDNGDILSTRYFDFNGALTGPAGIMLVNTSTVPLPTAFWLFLSGIAGMARVAMKKST